MSTTIRKNAGIFFVDYEAFTSITYDKCFNAEFLRFGSVAAPNERWIALLIEDNKIIHMQQISEDGNLLDFSRLVMWRLRERKPKEWRRRKALAASSPDPMQKFYAHLFGFIWDAVSISHLLYGPEFANLTAEIIHDALSDSAVNQTPVQTNHGVFHDRQ